MPNLVRLCLKLKSNHWDFSEGPAFCTSTSGIEGLIPGLGKLRSHMPRGVAKTEILECLQSTQVFKTPPT